MLKDIVSSTFLPTCYRQAAQMNLANEIRIVIFRTNSTNQLNETSKTTAILHLTIDLLSVFFATDQVQ